MEKLNKIMKKLSKHKFHFLSFAVASIMIGLLISVMAGVIDCKDNKNISNQKCDLFNKNVSYLSSYLIMVGLAAIFVYTLIRIWEL